MIKHTLTEAAQNPKVAHIVAASTAAAGVGTWFAWIPDDIGKLASLLGVILSTILIVVHGRKLINTLSRKEDESCTKSPTSTSSDDTSSKKSKLKV